jgi:hypothetical protein
MVRWLTGRPILFTRIIALPFPSSLHLEHTDIGPELAGGVPMMIIEANAFSTRLKKCQLYQQPAIS